MNISQYINIILIHIYLNMNSNYSFHTKYIICYVFCVLCVPDIIMSMVAYETVDDWMNENDLLLISSLALHHVTPKRFRRWATMIAEKTKAVMIVKIPDHFLMFGVRIVGAQGCYVLMGGTMTTSLSTLLSAIESVTGITCIDMSPTNEPRQMLLNGCAGYACAYAEFFMAMYDHIPMVRPNLSLQDRQHLINRARTILIKLRAEEQNTQRGVHNPAYEQHREHVAAAARRRTLRSASDTISVSVAPREVIEID